MKAFLVSMVVLVAVSLSARYLMDDFFELAADDKYVSSDNVRLD